MLRRKSSIDRLPEAARARLDAMLADPFNGLTYRDMLAAVEEDCGVALSYSALQRYAKKFGREVKQLKYANAELDRLRAALEGQAPADLSAQLLAMIQYALLHRVIDGQDDFGELSLTQAVKMALQATRVSTSVYRYQDQTYERAEIDGAEAAAAHMAWLRQALRDNPALLTELAEEDGDGLVRASGGDGCGGGGAGAPGPAELPGDAPEEDHAGAAGRQAG